MTMAGLNDVIHQPVRLRIMAILTALILAATMMGWLGLQRAQRPASAMS